MRRMNGLRISAWVAAVAVFAAHGAAVAKAKAKKQPPAEKAPPAAEAEKADEKPEGGGRFEEGPKKIELGHELQLDLPEGMLFVERVQAKQLMEKAGNVVGDDLLGLVLKKDSTWLITIEFAEEGYVKDDDAAELNPGEILDAIREGTEEANKIREERGFHPMHVDGWTEPPRYERQQHHVVWGIKGSSVDGVSINFRTRMLGRRGYVAVNLIDDPQNIEAAKREALAVLKATTYKPGSRYEDFDTKSDKVAEYGLAALVAGGAGAAALKLAKAGLLAKFGGKLIALIIAGKKAIIPLFIAIGAGVRKLLGMRKKDPPSAVASAPPGPAPGAPPPPEPPPPAGPGAG
jgi:uncharacterized membrane-anchored protein